MTSNPNYHNEKWLRQQYIKEERSTIDIAEECGCCQQTISNWLQTHGISIRPSSPVADECLTDRDWLYERYVKQQQSMTQIGDELGCSRETVSNWLNRHEIKKRQANAVTDRRLTDREWLYTQYVEQKKTMAEIGKECNCCASTVWKHLHRHNIKSRVASPPADERLADSDWVREQYIQKRHSTLDIAEKCDTGTSVVLDWFEKHGIETRPPGESIGTGKDNARWKGGEIGYGHGWNISKKREVRKRDNHTCQDPRCSVTQTDHIDKHDEKLHVHHLRKARNVDDPEKRNAKENLITLCRNCHTRWEKIADAGLVPQLGRESTE
jgi:DNA-binding CsgD family transcriptional regulator